MDESDDDLIIDKNVDKLVFEDHEISAEKDDNMYTYDESVYIGSDEERMTANFIDKDEPNFPKFNEEVDMKSPIFELGMLFKNSHIFRIAVENHAIMDGGANRTSAKLWEED